jgi:pyruvate,orthophosphate dikinase
VSPSDVELDPEVLGGKGAGLARAASAGLPVPPAIVLPAISPSAEQSVPEAWLAELPAALAALGGPRRVSVRSSPTASMPGMLDTVLDVEPTPEAIGTALERVLHSWWSPRATAYRERAGLETAGLAVVVQAMVFGDADDDSGSGVGFTRDPRTGAPTPLVEFLPGARGAELVGGRRTPPPADELRSHWPVVWDAVGDWVPRLERVFGDVQEFELTVESGRPYLLQSRTAKRTAAARVRVAHDLCAEGLVAEDEARRRIANVDLTGLVQRRLDPDGRVPLAEALVASPGVAAGRLALSRASVEALAASGDPIVLATTTTDPADYPVLRWLAGLLTRHGGVTSHAAVAALEARVPALVGCEELTIDLERGLASFERATISEGEWISLEGRDRGFVFAGRLPEGAPELSLGISEEILEWAHRLQLADGA